MIKLKKLILSQSCSLIYRPYTIFLEILTQVFRLTDYALCPLSHPLGPTVVGFNIFS